MNEIALAIRAKALRPELPLLITSGYIRPPNMETSSVGHFLAKPYTAQMLMEAVTQLLPESGSDSGAKQVTIVGTKVRLQNYSIP